MTPDRPLSAIPVPAGGVGPDGSDADVSLATHAPFAMVTSLLPRASAPARLLHRRGTRCCRRCDCALRDLSAGAHRDDHPPPSARGHRRPGAVDDDGVTATAISRGRRGRHRKAGAEPEARRAAEGVAGHRTQPDDPETDRHRPDTSGGRSTRSNPRRDVPGISQAGVRAAIQGRGGCPRAAGGRGERSTGEDEPGHQQLRVRGRTRGPKPGFESTESS